MARPRSTTTSSRPSPSPRSCRASSRRTRPTRPEELSAQGFDAVFDLCGIGRSDGSGTYVVHPIDDVPWLTDREAIDNLGEQVADLVRSGKRVVVNCMSGLNRSGLLVARALIALGHEPADAIQLVRRARGPRALSNRAFVRYLLIDCTPRRLAARRAT